LPSSARPFRASITRVHDAATVGFIPTEAVGVPRKEILQSAEVRSQQGAIAGEDPIAST
jgi:hypothetical protein